MTDPEIKLGYFDQPATRKMLWRLLWAFCALTVVLEAFVHREHHFAFDNFYGFYAVLGFAACTVCILVAKGLAFFLKAKEGYYDE